MTDLHDIADVMRKTQGDGSFRREITWGNTVSYIKMKKNYPRFLQV